MLRFFIWNRSLYHIWGWLTLILLAKWTLELRPKNCAPDCTCASVKTNPLSNIMTSENGKRVKCYNPDTITAVESISVKQLPPDIIHLYVVLIFFPI